MKRVFMIMVSLLAMLAASTGLKAQEVTITLIPGWTWISCPTTEAVDFATALGDFTPMTGDAIKSQWGNAYYRNGRWAGSISEFYPGYGYKYYSNRPTPVTVTFNAQQPSSQVVVSTSEPMLITAISAMGGGEVTTTDGTYIIVKGLCWAAHENPTTNDDFYQEAESGVGSFSISMTGLNISTTYYVRAYAVTPNGTVYGDPKAFTTRDGIPTVTTAEVTGIFGTHANCGGTVTDNGGLNVIARGVCWSTMPNPTLNDSHTTNGSGLGSFTSIITGMNVDTTYFVRAYASTTQGTGYGEEFSITTLDGDYVDLGLPSGLLWATRNVDAEHPTAYGGYYAWGETQPKTNYIWNTYQFGNWNALTKYCNNPEYGYNGFTDNLTILLPEDDAASINWGAEWRMPTRQEWQELIDNTTCIWTTQNGVNGRLFTASNGNNLFLPAAGNKSSSSLYGSGNYGLYWSSSFCSTFGAWILGYGLNYYGCGGCGGEEGGERSEGYSVRPVRCKNSSINVTANPSDGGTVSGGGTYLDHTSCTVTATANEGFVFAYWKENGEIVSTEANYTFVVSGNRTLVANYNSAINGHGYIDLGLPSGTLWATCNVGADTSEEYGDYFAWGETQSKDTYNWSTYQYANGSYNTLTKYCNISNYGYNGFTDDQTTLLPEDDAATANWGSGWRMPTVEEWLELNNNTTHTWTTRSGVYGQLFTASNGNSLFLPAAGARNGSSLYGAGSLVDYWSSSLGTDYPESPNEAWTFFYEDSDAYCVVGVGCSSRSYGQSVRSVRCKNSIINVTANPSDCGLVSGGGSYMDHTSCTVFATANEGYAFTWWSEDGEVVSTDASYSFVVNGNRNLVANFVATGEHSYVDLGLPSGTLWATCNVGADAPEEFGEYFAWGETQPKDYYDWSNYQHCNGTETTLTKYITEPDYSYDFEIVDYLTTLLPEDDAATANWGADWRVPTVEEWEELLENTTYSWTFMNGVYGRIFTASNGNSIFLPATYYFYDEEYGDEWYDGFYMSSSLVTDEPFTAWNLFLNVIDLDTGEDFIVDTREGYRCNAHSVRAVRSVFSNNVPTGAIDGKFTINEVGDQVYFSQGNLQYIGSASTPYWKFANNQWDCLGDNGQGSTIQTVDRDMFGWGTSGYNHGAICYQPWSTSQTSSNYYAYGNSAYNLFDQTGQADWGYNPISNGGNIPNAWRTLTQPEWSYIFNTRATTSGIRYAKAQVNDVNGVILLPDDWSPSTYNLNNVNTSSASFSSNTITVSQWTTFENAGAVFLPAAGDRLGADDPENGGCVYNVGSRGFYWSSSRNNNSYARNVLIKDEGLSTNDSNRRCYGFSVRLVRVAE